MTEPSMFGLSVFCLFHLYLLSGWWKVRGEKKKKKQKTFKTYSDGNETTPYAGHLGLIPGLGRSPGEENGDPHQYSCLENPMDDESGGLQSMGSWRVGQDWATFTFLTFLGWWKIGGIKKKPKKQKSQKICKTCRQERSASGWIMEW